MEEGLVNALGGCCGSRPEHIAAIVKMSSGFPPRKRRSIEPALRLSGLEPLEYRQSAETPRSTFLNVGERCNVAGSIMYKKAIVDGDYDKAHAIALKQVRSGTCRGPGTDSRKICNRVLMRGHDPGCTLASPLCDGGHWNGLGGAQVRW